MHSAGEPPWPVLEGGPVPVALAADRAWVHDGYRMRLAGRGARLESVLAGEVVMEAVRHDEGDAVSLHPDRAESRRGQNLYHRWATALELPLFVWERAGAGEVSWVTPLAEAAVEASAGGTRLTLHSRTTSARIVFETSSGVLRVADGGRITWNAAGPDRLLAIAAAGDSDLDRSLDLIGRRTLSGLGRQRAQHAEQLHRGGSAMRSTAIPSLEDAFDWAKVRGDALLGGLLADAQSDHDRLPTIEALAGGMLAAGLSQHARALRRMPAQSDRGPDGAFAAQLDAWTGGPESPFPERVPDQQTLTEGRPRTEFRFPPVEDIASGSVDAQGIASLLTASIGGLWGVLPDAPRGVVTLAPDVAALGNSAALSRLRIGRTVLDVRLRRRGEVVFVGVRRGAGPATVVDCTLRGAAVAEMLMDGEALPGSRARFEIRDAHDVQFHLSAQPPLSSPPS